MPLTFNWMRRAEKEGPRTFAGTRELYKSDKAGDKCFRIDLCHRSQLIDAESEISIITVMERVTLPEEMHCSADWFSSWYEITTFLKHEDGTTIELHWEAAEMPHKAVEIFLQEVEFDDREMLDMAVDDHWRQKDAEIEAAEEEENEDNNWASFHHNPF